MIKTIGIIMGVALGLTGCNDYETKPRIKLDQVRRELIFKECMTNLPAGPRSTKYNDWDEVVASCSSTAYNLSWICVANCEKSAFIQVIPETEKD